MSACGKTCCEQYVSIKHSGFVVTDVSVAEDVRGKDRRDAAVRISDP